MTSEIEYINLSDNINEFINSLEIDIKIGIAYNKYKDWKFARIISYKTFQRSVQELAERELIQVKKIIGGAYGSTTIILKKMGSKDNE